VIPQPLTVATNWGAAATLPLAVLVAALAAAFTYYWRLLRKPRPLPARAILVFAIAGLFVAWCSPLLFSSDVYAYAAYGELARIGLNPYAPIPPGVTDPLVRAAQVQWVTAFPMCVYGPLFVALAQSVVAALARFGPLAQLDAFRAIASIALLLCIPLSMAAYRGDRAARLRAAVTIALNPVSIWCAAEGHNDALALAVVLAGFAALRAPQLRVGAAIVAASALIKAPGAAALIAMAVAVRRLRAVAITSGMIVVALSWPLIAGALAHVAGVGRYAPQASVQAIAAPLGEVPAIAVAAILAALLSARGIAHVRAGAQEGWIWLGLACWALIPNPYPWYGIWLLAVAATAPRSRPGVAAIALTLTSLLRYIPDAVATPSASGSVALGVLAALPLFWAILDLRMQRGPRSSHDPHGLVAQRPLGKPRRQLAD
jgi:hypothetical protein